MDFISALPISTERDGYRWITESGTLELIRSAARHARDGGLLATLPFAGLFLFLVADTKKDKSDEEIVRRFKACFAGKVPAAIQEAREILEQSKIPCCGRFSYWTKPPSDLALFGKVVADVLSADPVKCIEQYSVAVGGEFKGVGINHFTEICNVLRDDLFPIVNLRTAAYFPQGMNYGLLAERLGAWLDENGFPLEHRFTYLDRFLEPWAQDFADKDMVRRVNLLLADFRGHANAR